MVIIAKFASVCPCCSQRIEVGSKVEWTKGSKARHVACSAAPTRSTRYRPAGYPRREDCRRYGWDGVYGSASYYSSGQYDEDS
jgi:hypothetical protein